LHLPLLVDKSCAAISVESSDRFWCL